MLSSRSRSGLILIDVATLKNTNLGKIRKLWSCFDIISHPRLPNSGLYSAQKVS